MARRRWKVGAINGKLLQGTHDSNNSSINENKNDTEAMQFIKHFVTTVHCIVNVYFLKIKVAKR